MEIYLIVKLLHVLAAMVWLGGGFCLLTIGIIADRTRNAEELLRLMQTIAYLGNRMFVPAALVTLLCGVAMVWVAWSFSEFWIMLALGGFALSFALGTGIIKPRSDRLLAMAAREGASPAVVEQCREVIRHGKLDYVILFLIVVVMVLKPGLQDHALLAAMGVLLAGSAAFLLGPRSRMPAWAPDRPAGAEREQEEQ